MNFKNGQSQAQVPQKFSNHAPERVKIRNALLVLLRHTCVLTNPRTTRARLALVSDRDKERQVELGSTVLCERGTVDRDREHGNTPPAERERCWR